MKENLVSFSVAKLAKEKGFNINTYSYYNIRKELRENFSIVNQYEEYYIEDKGNFLLIPYNDNYNYIYLEKIDFNDWKDSYSAPSQTVLQKWLREKHNIEIIVAPKFYGDGSIWYCYECLNMKINNIDTMKGLFTGTFTLYNTYEQALEVGLKEGLKLIK